MLGVVGAFGGGEVGGVERGDFVERGLGGGAALPVVEIGDGGGEFLVVGDQRGGGVGLRGVGDGDGVGREFDQRFVRIFAFLEMRSISLV